MKTFGLMELLRRGLISLICFQLILASVPYRSWASLSDETRQEVQEILAAMSREANDLYLQLGGNSYLEKLEELGQTPARARLVKDIWTLIDGLSRESSTREDSGKDLDSVFRRYFQSETSHTYARRCLNPKMGKIANRSMTVSGGLCVICFFAIESVFNAPAGGQKQGDPPGVMAAMAPWVAGAGGVCFFSAGGLYLLQKKYCPKALVNTSAQQEALDASFMASAPTGQFRMAYTVENEALMPNIREFLEFILRLKTGGTRVTIRQQGETEDREIPTIVVSRELEKEEL